MENEFPGQYAYRKPRGACADYRVFPYYKRALYVICLPVGPWIFFYRPSAGNKAVGFRGAGNTAPAWAIIEQHHIDAWIREREEY